MKKFAAAALAALMLLSLAACSENSKNSAKDSGTENSSDSTENTEITLDSIAAANDSAAALTSYGSLFVSYIEYDPDGNIVLTQSSDMRTRDNDYFYINNYNNEGWEFESEGIYYYHDNTTDGTELYALTPETYAADIAGILEHFIFSADDTEQITDISKADGKYVVTAETDMNEDISQYIGESYNLTADKLYFVYTMDEKTLLMQSVSEYVMTDDDKFTLTDVTFTYGEEQTLPDFASSILAASTENVTVMLDGKVNSEYSIPSGAVLLTDYLTYDGYELYTASTGGEKVTSMSGGNTYYFVKK